MVMSAKAEPTTAIVRARMALMVAQLVHEPALAPSALRGGGLLLQHVGEDGDLGAVFALVAVELVDEVIVERVFSAVPRQSTGPAKLLHRQAGDERHHLYVVLVVFGQRFLAALTLPLGNG